MLKILTLVFVLPHVYLREEQSQLFIVRDLGVAQDFLSFVVENKKFVQFQFPLNLTWWSLCIASDSVDFRCLGPISKLSRTI